MFERISTALAAAALIATLIAATTPASAQFGPIPTGSDGPARDAAPFDPTGYWVAIVTEDWRFRMATAPRGDFPGLPLTAEGRELANAWDPDADTGDDGACRYYGAPALMRIPTRIHVSWRDENTLRIETDNGRQTRLLHFADARAGEEASRQGVSRAQWVMHRDRAGGPVESGSIRVDTDALAPGYLRWNGVPYSARTTMTEFIDAVAQPNGDRYLIFKTMIDDPRYFSETIITSSNFRRESGNGNWNPRPCHVPEPPDLEDAVGYR